MKHQQGISYKAKEEDAAAQNAPYQKARTFEFNCIHCEVDRNQEKRITCKLIRNIDSKGHHLSRINSTKHCHEHAFSGTEKTGFYTYAVGQKGRKQDADKCCQLKGENYVRKKGKKPIIISNISITIHAIPSIKRFPVLVY